MSYTVQQVIDTVLKEIPGAPREHTVDTLKSGDPAAPVTGIVTTFTATLDVLRQARQLGANLVITHEPTYYNHRDEVDWLAEDVVYAAKRRLIDESGLAVWRFHDHWHMHNPDGIYTGLTAKMGWESFQDAENKELYHLPPVTLAGLVEDFKRKLGLPLVRTVGPAEMLCRSVVVVVGSMPGDYQLKGLFDTGADLLVCGETVEWQVFEYIRDSNAAGLPKGLIALGHEVSEEPGMDYLVEWLGQRLPGVTITHLSAGDPLVIR
jgi:putative NIF3 family GTP cyclohydrolase 1 type 2